jgi:hypothetical protein
MTVGLVVKQTGESRYQFGFHVLAQVVRVIVPLPGGTVTPVGEGPPRIPTVQPEERCDAVTVGLLI